MSPFLFLLLLLSSGSFIVLLVLLKFLRWYCVADDYYDVAVKDAVVFSIVNDFVVVFASIVSKVVATVADDFVGVAAAAVDVIMQMFCCC